LFTIGSGESLGKVGEEIDEQKKIGRGRWERGVVKRGRR